MPGDGEDAAGLDQKPQGTGKPDWSASAPPHRVGGDSVGKPETEIGPVANFRVARHPPTEVASQIGVSTHLPTRCAPPMTRRTSGRVGPFRFSRAVDAR